MRDKDPAEVQHWNAAGVLAKRVLTFAGAQARLVELLADPDKRMADLASTALVAGPAVDPRFLPQLVAALDRDLRNLPIALGSIHTDEAARHLVRHYMASNAYPGGAAAEGVKREGALAVPHLVEATRNARCCDHADAARLAGLLHEMQDKAAGAAPGLMAIANDAASSDALAGDAVSVLSALGVHANAMAPQLVALRARRPAITDAIDSALVAIGAPSGEILSSRLGKANAEEREWILRDIARAGPAARGVGPDLVRMLADADPAVRLQAVDAIGRIGYTQGVDALVPLLDDPRDVKLNWTAAEALGRLQAPQAIPALEHTAASHWYPDVRDEARRAIDAIRTGTAVEQDEFAWTVDQLGADAACDVVDVRVAEPGRRDKLRSERDDAALKKLAYASTVVGYGAAEGTAPVDGIIHVTEQNMVRNEEHIEQVPSVGLRVDGGWLVGGDRGEWGGELVFFGDDGLRQTIRDGNIQGLGRIGDRIVAAGGIAHMTLNDGMLLDVRRGDDGRWQATAWRGLPGAPRDLLRVDDDTSLVRTQSGDILVDADGTLRLARCKTKRR
ncbi:MULTISPECIES: HEAT repeat domain-containing protein [Lysobacteraceae]|uniref:HEAT repeat domain-containing protein n=1 Tax=Lysobacteraceae TaxID=32033 RepID=UPI001BCD344C|nr:MULTISPECIES: HEAT repeat domain-containing protein [Lysobacter]